MTELVRGKDGSPNAENLGVGPMREVWGIRGGWSGRQSSQPASHCFGRLCSGFDTGHWSFISLETKPAQRSKSKTKSDLWVFCSPDRETLRGSRANAASYFLVLEEQSKKVGLQKCTVSSKKKVGMREMNLGQVIGCCFHQISSPLKNDSQNTCFWERVEIADR